MDQDHLPYLLALHREQDWARAAQACGVSQAQLMQQLSEAERDYGRVLIQPGTPFRGFTDEGLSVVAWAQEFADAVASLKTCFAASRRQEEVAPLLARRSVSPKRLGLPGPAAEDIDLMVQAALSAPDHGGLRPWRVMVFEASQRERLADLFEQEKRRRDPLASADDLSRAREHATRPPGLLAFVLSPQSRMRVPEREQMLAAGAALGNLLNAAHQLGHGAILLSGERCFDAVLAAQLGLSATESLAGFISLGRIVAAPPKRKAVPVSQVLSTWPEVGARSLSSSAQARAAQEDGA